ncbi:gp14 [Shigella phage Buco]|uniref:Uncharacterized protein n=1 Tax=Shigella phage Buco TaxID=2530183 RepID=A0A482JMF2_9CAUD|nr:gp14 [Shigella phage Buco]QBP32914.1 hypothetical protein HRP29_gp14 [Shigella phage Buco]
MFKKEPGLTLVGRKLYRGVFGNLYTVNSFGVVCVQTEGSEKWEPSHYSLKGFNDAVEKGYLKEEN